MSAPSRSAAVNAGAGLLRDGTDPQIKTSDLRQLINLINSTSPGFMTAAGGVLPALPGAKMPHQTAEEIARDVLSYFLRNPEAADDLEGVARWRLLQETIERSVDDTNWALEWLVERGYLVKIATPAAGVIYRLNRCNQPAAESFVTRDNASRRD